MTLFVPLEASSPFPQSPSFLLPAPDPAVELKKVIKAILKAKRIVVVCGAGISVQAGIPDFRSPEGLFKTLKRDNPRESMASGKDLFDASVFNSEHTTSLFCQMIARLSELSKIADPTPFHHVLRSLDDRGRLLRVYTQNIDAIELKSGLSFGVPDFEVKRLRCKARTKACKSLPLPVPLEDAEAEADTDLLPEGPWPTPTPQRLPSPPAETPRCIPLHGTLQWLHCQTCTHSFPLEDHLPSLASGTPPQCPECTSMEATRLLVGKRARGVGKLRPSVVLYNEDHKDGEEVGEVVRKDLIGSSKGKGRSGADLLLVVGTSLRVKGTKRIVREFAKAVHSRSTTTAATNQNKELGLPSPAPSPRRSPVTDEEQQPMKAVYLNYDFPVPTREWEGVFDVWLQGDAQLFASMLQEEIEKELKAKELAIEKKRRREEEAILTAEREAQEQAKAAKKNSKRKGAPASSIGSPTTAKRRKIVGLPSPPKSKRKSLSSATAAASTTPTSSKITIRIPARRRTTPEVYIDTLSPPPSSSHSHSHSLRKTTYTSALPTPSPPHHPARRKPVPRTKAARKAARDASRAHPKSTSTSSPKKTSAASSAAIEAGDQVHEEDGSGARGGFHKLVRTVQYGLRGSRGAGG